MPCRSDEATKTNPSTPVEIGQICQEGEVLRETLPKTYVWWELTRAEVHWGTAAYLFESTLDNALRSM